MACMRADGTKFGCSWSGNMDLALGVPWLCEKWSGGAIWQLYLFCFSFCYKAVIFFLKQGSSLHTKSILDDYNHMLLSCVHISHIGKRSSSDWENGVLGKSTFSSYHITYKEEISIYMPTSSSAKLLYTYPRGRPWPGSQGRKQWLRGPC